MRTLFNWPKPGQERGFTLVEVMIASLVFLLAAAAALAAIGGVQRTMTNARRLGDAAFILQTTVERLQSMNQYICSATYADPQDLLADNDAGPPTAVELGCFGLDSQGIGNCPPDYPRVPAPGGAGASDLNRIYGQAYDGSVANPIWRVGTGVNGFPMLTYKGTNYRVVWNIACDMPLIGAKTVQVMVGWEPFATALQQGRFVLTQFTKSEGL